VSAEGMLSIINSDIGFGRGADAAFLISRDLFPLHVVAYSRLNCQFAAPFLPLILVSGTSKGER